MTVGDAILKRTAFGPAQNSPYIYTSNLVRSEPYQYEFGT